MCFFMLIFLFLENVLLEVDEYVRHNNSINIMNSFSREVHEIEQMLLDPRKIVCESAGQLITFLGKQNHIITSIFFLLNTFF